ncbi:MAG: hypothetical protein OEL56_00125 [Nitrosopumilus sp.]|nr:hypothetical protein [Nitrosopumilus sp.]MDH3515487.1 hypothetical protein [Nitrosopumilus sp.]MDH3565554.1 hypothetical protein [Nitrosopumilus sp.]MDH5416748.1 hypothetical protein [Nitrosopumilus sp.]MDH5555212.1 hypothetical protein [Nitrosopumilus sp.]
MSKIQQVDWSEWLDFNQNMISKTPETSGVFMMHAGMKILYIGGSENMRKTIENISEKCVSDATRFRYSVEKDFEKRKRKLIADYKKRHEGKSPECMS